MAQQEPSIDQWLAEAKQDPNAAQCGMYLTHNGIVRITPKKQVREGVEGLGEVAQVEFSYDAAGVEAAVQRPSPGRAYTCATWLNEGVLNVGDSIMYVLIGADIRELHRRAAKLVGKIRTTSWRRRDLRVKRRRRTQQGSSAKRSRRAEPPERRSAT
ncbi:MAG: molybdopterin biosynthesis protein [Eggerthellaceae bacterium]